MYTIRTKNWFDGVHRYIDAFETGINKVVHSEVFWVVMGFFAAVLLVWIAVVLSQGDQPGNSGLPVQLYPYPF